MNSSTINSLAFIASPVRSGSTLLHVMLDSHPNISNPGECDYMFDLIDDNGVQPGMREYITWPAISRIFLAKQLHVDEKLSYPDLMKSFLVQLL